MRVFALSLVLLLSCFSPALAQSCAGSTGNGSGCAANVGSLNTIEKQISAGWGFIAGTGQLTAGVLTNARLAITNPGGNTRTCYVYAINGGGTALAYTQVWYNPTNGVPVTGRTESNLLIASGVNVPGCQVFADTGAAPTTGTNTGVFFPFPSAGATNIAVAGQYFGVAPGNTLELVTSIALGVGFSQNISWVEF